MKKQIKMAREIASKKGLLVRKGMSYGWSVTLPSGVGFHTLSDADMIKYVRAY